MRHRTPGVARKGYDTMNQHHRSRGARHALNGVLLLVALVLAALGLTQCRVIDDSVTGVDLKGVGELHGKGNNSRCIRRCNEEYREARQREKERHRQALKKCSSNRDDDEDKKDDDARKGGGDPQIHDGQGGDDDGQGGDDDGKGDDSGKKGDRRERERECRREENARHRAILDQLKADRLKCKSGCYNEGGGQGGR
jgi:hypothetical protein